MVFKFSATLLAPSTLPRTAPSLAVMLPLPLPQPLLPQHSHSSSNSKLFSVFRLDVPRTVFPLVAVEEALEAVLRLHPDEEVTSPTTLSNSSLSTLLSVVPQEEESEACPMVEESTSRRHPFYFKTVVEVAEADVDAADRRRAVDLSLREVEALTEAARLQVHRRLLKLSRYSEV